VEQIRLEEYKKLLSSNPLCLKTVERCIRQVDRPEEKMYLTVWAPAMLEYVLWVLREAARHQKKRLYFLSRDAYPMYLMAVKLAEVFQLGIECRYLRVSRYSLRIPEYHLIGEGCLDRIFLSGIDVSLYQILKRADFTEAEMKQVCREAGFNDDLHRILNRREIFDLKERFGDRGTSFFSYVNAHSKEAFGPAIGYLEQEGLLEDVPWALVDSGWVGTIQVSIRNLLAVRKPEISVEGYYFGLYEYPDDTERCRYHSYYFAPRGSVGKKAGFSNCLYEAVYSEPQAMVMGYRRDGTRFVPVFHDRSNPNSTELESYAKLVQLFAMEYSKIFSDSSQKQSGMEMPEAFVPVAEGLYRKLMASPNAWEAAYYGNFLFSDDICDRQMKPAANSLTQQEIKDLRVISKLKIMLRLSHKVIHESAWIEGSIVNAGRNITKNLRAARRSKYLTHLRQSMRAYMKNRKRFANV